MAKLRTSIEAKLCHAATAIAGTTASKDDASRAIGGMPDRPATQPPIVLKTMNTHCIIEVIAMSTASFAVTRLAADLDEVSNVFQLPPRCSTRHVEDARIEIPATMKSMP